MAYPPVEEIRRRLDAADLRRRTAIVAAFDAAEARRQEEHRQAQSLRQVRAYGRKLEREGRLTRLAQIRIDLGYSVEAFAALLGVDHEAYRRAERPSRERPSRSSASNAQERATRERIVRAMAELGLARMITKDIRDDEGR